MLTAAMENNLKEGDLVLYKDFTEANWSIGVYSEYNKDTQNKCKHRIVTGIAIDDEGNPDTNNLLILPYRYAVKFNLKSLEKK